MYTIVFIIKRKGYIEIEGWVELTSNAFTFFIYEKAEKTNSTGIELFEFGLSSNRIFFTEGRVSAKLFYDRLFETIREG